MKSLPNILTWGRIFAIPLIILVYYLPFEWVNIAVAIIFFTASWTDWLDGYLARKWNQTSRFGAFLDPVADKLMVSVALMLIVATDPRALIVLPVIVIIGREIAVSALREWMAEYGARASVAVSFLGKLKTTIQMMAICGLLYVDDFYGFPTYPAAIVLLYVAAGLTLWSGWQYLRAAWPALREES